VVSQEQITNLQQNLRVAAFQLKRDLRMAGFDPTGSSRFGLTFIGFRNAANEVIANGQGNSAIAFTIDTDINGFVANNETITYSLFDGLGNGTSLDLARNSGGGRQLVAENIAAMGIAYAFDADGDGLLDTYNAGGAQVPFWAISTQSNGFLDRHLDVNGDGLIDIRDAPGVANGFINGVALAQPVPMDRIRAVRIWLLAEARNPDQSFFDNETYVVGNQVYTPRDNRRRRLLETTFKFKNLGVE
jgi:type IV pilus assembly protein PilW